jgi:hypothetical protein
MRMADGRGSSLRHLSTIGDPEAGDEQNGEWTRAKLREMDLQFREKLERAFRRGRETLTGARGVASER